MTDVAKAATCWVSKNVKALAVPAPPRGNTLVAQTAIWHHRAFTHADMPTCVGMLLLPAYLSFSVTLCHILPWIYRGPVWLGSMNWWIFQRLPILPRPYKKTEAMQSHPLDPFEASRAWRLSRLLDLPTLPTKPKTNMIEQNESEWAKQIQTVTGNHSGAVAKPIGKPESKWFLYRFHGFNCLRSARLPWPVHTVWVWYFMMHWGTYGSGSPSCTGQTYRCSGCTEGSHWHPDRLGFTGKPDCPAVNTTGRWSAAHSSAGTRWRPVKGSHLAWGFGACEIIPCLVVSILQQNSYTASMLTSCLELLRVFAPLINSASLQLSHAANPDNFEGILELLRLAGPMLLKDSGAGAGREWRRLSNLPRDRFRAVSVALRTICSTCATAAVATVAVLPAVVAVASVTSASCLASAFNPSSGPQVSATTIANPL